MAEIAFQDVAPHTGMVYQESVLEKKYTATLEEVTLADLAELQDEWCDLVSQGEYSEPFFQPYWFRAFLESFHKGKPAPFVFVRDGDTLKGILPLMRSRRFWGSFPARSLQGLFGIHSCRFDFICETKDKDKIAEAAWGALERDSSWTVLQGQNVPEDGAFESLMRHAARSGYFVVRWPTLFSPYLNIPVGAKDPLQNCPERYKKDRKRLRSRLQKLQEQGEVSYEVLTHFDEDFFRNFLHLEGAGWKGEAGGAIRCNPAVVEFYRRVLQYAAAEDHLRMCAMKLNGRRISMELAFVTANKCYSPKITYDEDLSKYGPGQIMALFGIPDLADRGIKKYDLLGPRARHKAIWAGEIRPHANCFIFRPNVFGTACYLFASRLAPMLKRAKYKRYGDPQSLGDEVTVIKD